MNNIDLDRLKELNERHGPTNLTGFRFVDKTTDEKTVLQHIKTDLKVLDTTDVEYKHVCRIILDDDCIEVCTVDNGTIISYFFSRDAVFTPKSIREDVKELCEVFDVHFEG